VKVAYGHDIKSDDDLYLTHAKDADHAMNYGASVGITILDTLPWRKQLLDRRRGSPLMIDQQ
jgi:hypothetical protein